MRTFLILTLFPLLSLAAQPDVPPGLDDTVAAYVKKKDPAEKPVFRSMPVDLNADNMDDAVVLLTGPNWCGSGGCTLLVFRGTPSSFKLVSKSTVTDTPIRVSDEQHEGWRTLVVHSRGIGDVAMRFDGKRYPANPSLQEKASPEVVAGAKVLLE